MEWRRLGLIYSPQGEEPWLTSHASVPFIEPLDGSLARIWFSPRDLSNRSCISWLVIDLTRPSDILARSSAPILACGELGSFDDCGAMMSWIASGVQGRLLYYIGWNKRETVPFHVSIGVAQETEGRWIKRSGPILDRNSDDPWFCSNPCVIQDRAGWRMWYLSGLGWERLDRGLSASYHIAHARSEDGMTWTDRGRTAVPLTNDEFAIARPSILREGDDWLLWFCTRTRHRPYRLGAARSEDGLNWERAPDLANLHPASNGWDSEMVAYPHVINHAGARWMVYCGNGFGRSGFGLAVWD
jgi:hypothetical protein